VKYDRGSDGLADSVFSFGQGDSGSILCLCVTLCFLPRRNRILMLNKRGSLIKIHILWIDHGPFLKQVIGLIDPSV